MFNIRLSENFCPSYIELCVSDNKLKVISYDMMHRSSFETKPNSVLMLETLHENEEDSNGCMS